MAAPANCPRLKIPWPDPRDQGDPIKMAENWKALEQWADKLLKCLCDCGGGEG